MRWNGSVAIAVLLLAMAGSQPAVLAQEEPSEPPSAEAPAEPTTETPAEPEPETQKKKHFGLWVYTGVGMSSADPLNTSIESSPENSSENYLSFDDMKSARVEVGWKLDNRKGDFRLRFNGYAEDSYKLDAVGYAANLPSGQGAASIPVLQGLRWWTLTIDSGLLSAERTPPQWDLTMDDADGDGAVSRDEVRYIGADLEHTREVADDLQNRPQYIEGLYGREWGGRRYSGRWWAGLRYFKYEGNVLAGAWLNLSQPGEGYTDGTTLRLINFAQETTAFGPTGIMEADFNFFDRRLQFYLQGQAAFMISDLQMQTGRFFTMVNTQTAPFVVVPVEANLDEDRSKSTWQTAAELGVRLNLRIGLTIDLAYRIEGFLDTVLIPSRIQFPVTLSQAAQGTAAIYSTHDIVVDGWRAGVGFQF